MRRLEIDIDGKKFIEPTNARQFRVVFTIKSRYTERLSYAEIGIYNLSRNTQIEQGKTIELRAGYDEEFGTIFRGRITTVLREREGANVITRLLCLMNGQSLRNSIQASLGAGSTIFDALQLCAQAWGLPLVIDPTQFDDVRPFVRGYVLNGDLAVCLDTLAKQFNFCWIETADAIVIDRPDKDVSGLAREVSLFKGMIGVPEAEGDVIGAFVNVTHRLCPMMRMASKFELKSEYASYSTGNFYIMPPKNGGKLSGFYKVVELEHSGDSCGQRWETKIRGQHING